ncbi:MAG: BON domain-containing protein, partial [Sedimentitalea sp.]
MKVLLIVLVLLGTGSAFYSALRYKSVLIEDDITTRVRDDLGAADLRGIDVDVDGRHVTLSGVVYDEAAETRYLDTAKQTYGALGPIDGLTLQPDAGFITATKTADGITLRGTAPSDAARAALVDAAQGATEGSVDDQLSITGPDAAWRSEASFGLAQLGKLSAGTMTAAAGAFALSGSTDADPDTINSALSTREGWRSFVSSTANERNLSADVARLSGDVALRDGTVTELETALAMRDGTVSELETALATRDGTVSELEAELAARDGTVSELETALAARDGTVTELEATLSERTGALSQLETTLTDRSATLLDLESAARAQDATVSELDAVLAQRDGRISQLEA